MTEKERKEYLENLNVKIDEAFEAFLHFSDSEAWKDLPYTREV